MTVDELTNIIESGEDSTHQFKRDFSNAEALAAELIAFVNTSGGMRFIGIADDGSIAGLSAESVRRLNQLLSNVASQNVRPPLNPITQNIATKDGLVMVVEIQPGNNKPYLDLQGRIWVKSGADKRQVTAREEMQRLFQQSGLVYADEVPVATTSHLPNHLNTEQIRYGLSNLRNPALASHAFHLLPYRGLGSGIPRATAAWPNIELVDDRRGNQFKAIVMRPVIKNRIIKPESQPESQPESLSERVITALGKEPLGKAEIAAALGMRAISAHLNQIIRGLLKEGRITMTKPEKPNSRLQKYQLKCNFEV